MQIELSQRQEQKLLLTPMMRQSLKCLQLPAMELREYVQEIALANPVLDVTLPPLSDPELPSPAAQTEGPFDPDYREESLWHSRKSDEEFDPLAICAREETFSEHLLFQLGQMRFLDDELRSLCVYLIGCLDHRGYLDCSTDELAQEIGCPPEDLMQALYAVQMLDPAGVGARDLQECLILQLAQSSHFNDITVRIVHEGLALLAKKDYTALASKLRVKTAAVEQAATVIRSLSPIPSRGFSNGEPSGYAVPEATISAKGEHITVTLSEKLLPQLSLSPEYLAMLSNTQYADAHAYLKEKLAEANALIGSVQARHQTLTMLLTELLEVQRDFLLGGALHPLTMQQMAQRLGVSASTVSRTVQDKYVLVNGKTMPLRSFFTAAVRGADGETVSVQTIKHQLAAFLQAEDPSAPLSDEALRLALGSAGFDISRRTVAKYRAELGFDIASRRGR